MPIVRILSILLIFPFCRVLFADQIVLSNGDRLTGMITKSDDKTLVLKTEFAADVTVQWPAVQEIHSTQPLHLVTQGGKTLVGTANTTDGTLIVSTLQSWHGHKTEQMAGMAECLRRYLCHESADW